MRTGKLTGAALLAGGLLASCSWFRPDPPHYEPVTREAGLVVHDLLVPDSGEEVALGDTVAIHYDLMLEDRTLVESSKTTGQPLRFEVGAGAVPRGVDLGVIGMRLFGRRRLSVPSELAFGSAGRPPRIPPDTPVIFDVELMERTPPPR